jgi:tRNA-splicing ligase RtcB
MTVKLQQIDDCRWRIPREGAMRTEGLVFADARMIAALQQEQALEQVRNVATLPGIVGPSLAMPDIHWGYGFPIGGVAAFDADEGVVSPGGVGYDINCGVRLLRSALTATEIKPVLAKLADTLFRNVPAGVGSERRDLRVSLAEQRRVLEQGAAWAVARGYGEAEDLRHIETGGRSPAPIPSWFPSGPWSGAAPNSAPWAAAIIFSKCRRWRKSSMKRSPTSSASSPARLR